MSRYTWVYSVFKRVGVPDGCASHDNGSLYYKYNTRIFQIPSLFLSAKQLCIGEGVSPEIQNFIRILRIHENNLFLHFKCSFILRFILI